MAANRKPRATAEPEATEPETVAPKQAKKASTPAPAAKTPAAKKSTAEASAARTSTEQPAASKPKKATKSKAAEPTAESETDTAGETDGTEEPVFANRAERRAHSRNKGKTPHPQQASQGAIHGNLVRGQAQRSWASRRSG
jgi:hypothetical protein